MSEIFDKFEDQLFSGKFFQLTDSDIQYLQEEDNPFLKSLITNFYNVIYDIPVLAYFDFPLKFKDREVLAGLNP